MQRPLLVPCFCLGLLAAAYPLLPTAAEVARQDAPAIEASHVRADVHLLTGSGGNIAVSAGPDGLLMIDDKFLNLAGDIQSALDALAADHELEVSTPRFLVNTHMHGDHTGGNPAFGTSATILAHDNVRARLASGDDPMEAAGLPVVTYAEGAALHMNGQRIDLVHVPTAHTDGDTLVHFRGANVLHLGDLGFIGIFPFIDLGRGGSVDGFVAGLDRALELGDADTLFVPGHGPVCGPDEVRALRDMLVEGQRRVAEAIAAGQSASYMRQAGILEDYAEWDWGFISTDAMIQTLYDDAQRD